MPRTLLFNAPLRRQVGDERIKMGSGPFHADKYFFQKNGALVGPRLMLFSEQ